MRFASTETRQLRGQLLQVNAALESILSCPSCGSSMHETMPTNACVFFYDCPSCGIRLKPKPGDCCVFCSYGSVPCPPIQSGMKCTTECAAGVEDRVDSDNCCDMGAGGGRGITNHAYSDTFTSQSEDALA